MNVMQVLEASKLFDSRTDIHRQVKNKAVKINGQPVDDVNETIELGDFLNFTWFPNAIEMMREHGRTLLVVSRGKKDRGLVKVVGDNIEVLF
jgi:RNA-binding protein YlmH